MGLPWSADTAVDAAVSRSSVDRERTRWMRDDPRPEFRVDRGPSFTDVMVKRFGDPVGRVLR